MMLEFLEKSLEFDATTGKYPNEDIIHQIIFPMRTTSDDVSYEQQNLWIIDEKLAFHWFLASDMLLSKSKPLVSDSGFRPDLMVFDRALSFAEDEGTLNSVVIVEFKKPMRKDFDKEDPVEQTYRLLRAIKAGQILNTKGRPVAVNGNIPTFIYIICDKTTELEIVAENRSMRPTPDAEGYYVYNDTLRAYVEIIPYAKLLHSAKKRNRVLFEKLHLPLHSSASSHG